jgi:hypothetical protein
VKEPNDDDPTSPADHEVPIIRATWYPHRSDLADDLPGGVLRLDLDHHSVDRDVVEPGRVTLASGGRLPNHPVGYEVDLTPDAARQPARLLEDAAGLADEHEVPLSADAHGVEASDEHLVTTAWSAL